MLSSDEVDVVVAVDIEFMISLTLLNCLSGMADGFVASVDGGIENESKRKTRRREKQASKQWIETVMEEEEEEDEDVVDVVEKLL